MERTMVVNEDVQLQSILEKNHNLLPGDQMNPEDPRRWLLIKREMPVPNPGSAVDCWRLDFLFADQDAIPTLVDCKRFANTQSRREVIGQVIEYAANGQYYWNKKKLREFAEANCKARSLDEVLRDLMGPNFESSDAFFDELVKNLQTGNVRIAFFLDQSPMELRSAVDFLSKQMQEAEVFLVEARQYKLNGTSVVIPALFGYTDQARKVFQSTVTVREQSEQWDPTSFFSDARKKIGEQADVLKVLYDRLVTAGIDLYWGKGTVNGSFSVRIPAMCPASLVNVNSAGWLTLNLGTIPESCGKMLKDLAHSVGLADREGMKFPGYFISDWKDKVERIVDELKRLATDPVPRE